MRGVGASHLSGAARKTEKAKDVPSSAKVFNSMSI